MSYPLFLQTLTEDGRTWYLTAAQDGRRGLGFVSETGDLRSHVAWKHDPSGALLDGQAQHVFLALNSEGKAGLRHRLAKGATPDAWKVEGGRVIHGATGKVLTVTRAPDGHPTGLAAVDATAAGIGDVVAPVPSNIITNILASPGSSPAFPPFDTDTEPQAYAYIMQNIPLGLPPSQQPTDLRAVYPTLSVDLTAATSWLTSVQYPSGVSFTQPDWTAVITQLQQEIACCNNVRSLYSYYDQFNTYLFSAENSALSTMQGKLDIDDETTCNYIAGAFIEGIIYAVASATGAGGGFIANVLAAGYNTALASGALGNEQLEIAFTNLRAQLDTDNDSVVKVIGQQEEQLLSNWSWMQAVSGDCGPGGPLSFSSTSLSNAETAGLAGYCAMAMQTVMPAIASVGIDAFSTQPPPSPEDNQWTLPCGTGVNTNFSMWFITPNFPVTPGLLQTYLWSAGILQQDVFLNLNGWNLNNTWYFNNSPWEGSAETNGDAVVIGILVNETTGNLAVQTTPAGDGSQTMLVPANVTLPAGGVIMVAAADSDGPAITIQINGQSNPPPSLQLSQSVGAWKGGTVSVGNLQAWQSLQCNVGQIVQPVFGAPGFGIPGQVQLIIAIPT
jgi:hypothetical protein